jgi:hypothetical protein
MASKRKVNTSSEKSAQVREITLGSLSIDQLVIVTGKSRKTVQVKIAKLKPDRQDNKGFYYSTKDAVAAIMQSDLEKDSNQDEAQLLKEKLKLETNKAEKSRIQLSLLKKEALPLSSVEKTWVKMLSTFRAKLLAIPSKISLELVGKKDVHEIEDRFTETLHEALSELKEFNVNDYVEGISEESGVSSSAAAETDS